MRILICLLLLSVNIKAFGLDQPKLESELDRDIQFLTENLHIDAETKAQISEDDKLNDVQDFDRPQEKIVDLEEIYFDKVKTSRAGLLKKSKKKLKRSR